MIGMAEHDKVIFRLPQPQKSIVGTLRFEQLQQRFVAGEIALRFSESQVKIFQWTQLILAQFCCLLKNKDHARMQAENKSTGNGKSTKEDRHQWLASLEYFLGYILKNEHSDQASQLLEELADRLRQSGIKIPFTVSTPSALTL